MIPDWMKAGFDPAIRQVIKTKIGVNNSMGNQEELKTYQITHRGTRERMNIKAKTFTDGCMDLGWKVCDCYYEIID